MSTPGGYTCERLARWHLLEINRFHEERAQVQLASRNITTYLPRTRQWPRPAVGSEIAPLFPGYLFVQVDCLEHYQATWCPGVKSFVSFDHEQPAVVPADVVDLLRSREGPDGIIECDDDGIDKRVMRVTRGAFRDYRGLVQKRLPARQRVVLLMNLLQRDVLVEVPEKWLKLA